MFFRVIPAYPFGTQNCTKHTGTQPPFSILQFFFCLNLIKLAIGVLTDALHNCDCYYKYGNSCICHYRCHWYPAWFLYIFDCPLEWMKWIAKWWAQLFLLVIHMTLQPSRAYDKMEFTTKAYVEMYYFARHFKWGISSYKITDIQRFIQNSPKNLKMFSDWLKKKDWLIHFKIIPKIFFM